MEVPVRELRDKLSKYLRLVRQGKRIVVTSHDKAIAVLDPLPRLDEPGLQEMIARGTVKWTDQSDPHRSNAAGRRPTGPFDRGHRARRPRMNLYLDSSAWVKLYVAEADRPAFRRSAERIT